MSNGLTEVVTNGLTDKEALEIINTLRRIVDNKKLKRALVEIAWRRLDRIKLAIDLLDDLDTYLTYMKERN